MINPGLAPWALKEYRPCRALCGRTLSSICRKSSDLLGGIVVCACCRICYSVSLLAFVIGIYYSVSLFVLVVEFVVWCRCLRLLLGFIIRCRCLHLLSDWLGGADVSAAGTILLQSPGWRECQRHEQNPG